MVLGCLWRSCSLHALSFTSALSFSISKNSLMFRGSSGPCLWKSRNTSPTRSGERYWTAGVIPQETTFLPPIQGISTTHLKRKSRRMKSSSLPKDGKALRQVLCKSLPGGSTVGHLSTYSRKSHLPEHARDHELMTASKGPQGRRSCACTRRWNRITKGLTRVPIPRAALRYTQSIQCLYESQKG